MAIDQAVRAQGIGASEISALFGMNPYQSAWDVWARKTGRLDGVDVPMNRRMRAGKAIERAIADLYESETGRALKWMDTTLQHPERSYQVYTPDALAVAEPGGVDCKAVAIDQYYSFGEPGTDQVPDHIALQAQWSCSASERDWWDIAALTGSELRIYRIVRDHEIEATLLEVAERFWLENVLGDREPIMKSTQAARAWLRAKYPRNSGVLRTPTDEERAIIEQYREARAHCILSERIKDDIEMRVKAMIGEDDGFDLGGGERITYRRSRDSYGTDWEALARELAGGKDISDAIERHKCVTRQGTRRIDCRFKGDK